MTVKMVATCLFGLESLLGAEIDKLGCKRTETMDGRIYFEGNEHQLAAANIRLRFAERVYINMGEFEAYSFNDLFEGTRALEWENYIGMCDMFPVKGHAIKSALHSIPDSVIYTLHSSHVHDGICALFLPCAQACQRR